jgi:ribosomal protein S18 acetylase RimI-like enzyme
MRSLLSCSSPAVFSVSQTTRGSMIKKSVFVLAAAAALVAGLGAPSSDAAVCTPDLPVSATSSNRFCRTSGNTHAIGTAVDSSAGGSKSQYQYIISPAHLCYPARMFASVALTHRIEAAEAALTLQVGRHIARRHTAAIAREIAGGAAVHTGQSSPMDKVIGLGFEPFDDAALSAFVAFEEAVLAHDRVVQVELATRADPSVARALARRGYALVGFEDVLGIDLSSVAPSRADARPSATEVVPVKVEELDLWIDVVATAFAHPDVGDGPESHESFPREAVERAMRDMLALADFTCYIARRDGLVVGGASLRTDPAQRIAQFTGAATLPSARRRGVQSALLGARLAAARSAGADCAVITTRPGSKSQQNAIESGFSLLYTRAVLLKPGAS